MVTAIAFARIILSTAVTGRIETDGIVPGTPIRIGAIPALAVRAAGATRVPGMSPEPSGYDPAATGPDA